MEKNIPPIPAKPLHLRATIDSLPSQSRNVHAVNKIQPLGKKEFDERREMIESKLFRRLSYHSIFDFKGVPYDEGRSNALKKEEERSVIGFKSFFSIFQFDKKKKSKVDKGNRESKIKKNRSILTNRSKNKVHPDIKKQEVEHKNLEAQASNMVILRSSASDPQLYNEPNSNKRVIKRKNRRSDKKEVSQEGTSQNENMPGSSITFANKNEKMIHEISMELLITEEIYIKDMKNIIENFYKPVIYKGWIKDREILNIFTTLQQILPVNELLYKSLIENFNEYGIQNLGETFLKLADYFKVYTVFCSQQSQILSKITKLIQTNKKINSYLSKFYSTYNFGGLNLQSFLLKPIQRLCKYPLFIKEFIKYSPKYERESLEKVLSKLEGIMTVINERIKQSENVQKTLDACMKIKFTKHKPIDLITPSRILLYDSFFLFSNKTNIKSRPTSKRRLYLFSDMILITKPNRFFKDRYSCILDCNISDIKVSSPMAHHNLGHMYSFSISTPTLSMTFYSESQSLVLYWTSMITATQESLKNNGAFSANAKDDLKELDWDTSEDSFS